jgi:hypothetical protein
MGANQPNGPGRAEPYLNSQHELSPLSDKPLGLDEFEDLEVDYSIFLPSAFPASHPNYYLCRHAPGLFLNYHTLQGRLLNPTPQPLPYPQPTLNNYVYSESLA